MTKLTRLLLVCTILTYFGFFLVETVLWSLPLVQEMLLPQLNPHPDYPYPAQAKILRSLFLNQGAYNLLLGLGGVYGLRVWGKAGEASALPMLRFLCCFAVGAAVTLLATTHAYVLGIVQLIFPIAALWSLARDAARLRAGGTAPIS